MLSQIDINILRLLTLGFGAREIASTLNLELNEYASIYADLMKKTKCWDEINLGVWWHQNQNEYENVFPNNLLSFDFTKITSTAT